MTAGYRPTVLVVEDEPQVRQMTTRMLDDAGFAVTDAGSATEALAMMVEPPDLAVVDICLPDMSGTDLARQVWRRQPALPIVFVSAFPEPALVNPDAQKLVRGFLQKPFSQAELVAAVRDLLPPM
jgi:CheY-like chemotaxis protein